MCVLLNKIGNIKNLNTQNIYTYILCLYIIQLRVQQALMCTGAIKCKWLNSHIKQRRNNFSTKVLRKSLRFILTVSLRTYRKPTLWSRLGQSQSLRRDVGEQRKFLGDIEQRLGGQRLRGWTAWLPPSAQITPVPTTKERYLYGRHFCRAVFRASPFTTFSRENATELIAYLTPLLANKHFLSVVPFDLFCFSFKSCITTQNLLIDKYCSVKEACGWSYLWLTEIQGWMSIHYSHTEYLNYYFTYTSYSSVLISMTFCTF